ncbi:hypothetical protein ACN8ZM_40410 (plasmid) [Burkholderia aenigmatica]|uniref:hypothetical protein n=1 Tax=Burkholderia aenigmatica TaxID=2015348 RepID=UPI003B42C6C0
MRIAQPELAGLKDAYSATIYQGPVSAWQVKLSLASGKLLEVVTQRGYPKTWRRLEDVLTFATVYCKAATSITVDFGEYVLKVELKQAVAEGNGR